jgi:hypothetical protein
MPFIVGQVDDHGVFIEASELRRVIVGIAEDWMQERFTSALHNDGLAGRPADVHSVRWNAIEVCECALNGLTVDICPGHKSYSQLEIVENCGDDVELKARSQPMGTGQAVDPAEPFSVRGIPPTHLPRFNPPTHVPRFDKGWRFSRLSLDHLIKFGTFRS